MKKFFSNIPLYGPLLVAIAATLWAIDGLFRISLYVMSPISIVFYEHLFGAVLISPFIFKALMNESFTKRDWILLFLISGLSSVLGTLFFTSALVKVNYISISVVFLLQKLQPIFATTSAVILLKEKVSIKFVGWAALAMAAAYFLSFPNGSINWDTGNETTKAALLAAAAAACWGTGTTLSRMFLLKHNSHVATGLRFCIATILSLALIPFLTGSSDLPMLNSSQFFSLLAIALSTGMVAMVIYYQGLKYTQAKVATIIELIFPLLGVLIDANKKTILGWFGVVDPYITNSFLLPTQFVAALILLYAIFRVSRLNNTTNSAQA